MAGRQQPGFHALAAICGLACIVGAAACAGADSRAPAGETRAADAAPAGRDAASPASDPPSSPIDAPVGPDAPDTRGAGEVSGDPSAPLADAAPGAAGDLASEGSGGIVVDNLLDDEVVPHDLVVIQGTATTGDSIELELAGRSTQWPIVGGQFRALAQLAVGPNQVILRAGTARKTVGLRYLPPSNPRFVRFVYLVAADGDGSFEGAPGQPHDQASALARLRVGARLMQAFTAETMRQQGFGRLTFRLARDAAHEPIIEVWKSKLTNAQARAMGGNALWSAFYSELGRLPERELSLDVAVMAMTHYVPASKTKQAHTALGGGRLGLFGSGTLFAHAGSFDDIGKGFADDRVVDLAVLPDDSAGRGTFWANYATGIGAMAHELGHCLSLPHPSSHTGLMWRGFDHFNRSFVAAEPKSKTSPGLAPVLPRDQAGIDRSNAVRLRFHRWLAPTDMAYQRQTPPAIAVDAAGLRLSSAAGIRHIQYLVAGEGAAHDEFLADAPASVTVPFATLRTRLSGATTVEVSAIDDDGNIATRSNIALP